MFSNYPTQPTVTIAGIIVDPQNISHPIPDGEPASWTNTVGAASISRVILTGQLEGTYTYYIWDQLGLKGPDGDPEMVIEGPAVSRLNIATDEFEVAINKLVKCNADPLDGSMKIAVRIVSLDPFNEMEDLVVIPNVTTIVPSENQYDPEVSKIEDPGMPGKGILQPAVVVTSPVVSSIQEGVIGEAAVAPDRVIGEAAVAPYRPVVTVDETAVATDRPVIEGGISPGPATIDSARAAIQAEETEALDQPVEAQEPASISITDIKIDPGAQTDNVQIDVQLTNTHHWHYIIDQGPEVMVKAYDEGGQLCSGQEDPHEGEAQLLGSWRGAAQGGPEAEKYKEALEKVLDAIEKNPDPLRVGEELLGERSAVLENAMGDVIEQFDGEEMDALEEDFQSRADELNEDLREAGIDPDRHSAQDLIEGRGELSTVENEREREIWESRPDLQRRAEELLQHPFMVETFRFIEVIGPVFEEILPQAKEIVEDLELAQDLGMDEEKLKDYAKELAKELLEKLREGELTPKELAKLLSLAPSLGLGGALDELLYRKGWIPAPVDGWIPPIPGQVLPGPGGFPDVIGAAAPATSVCSEPAACDSPFRSVKLTVLNGGKHTVKVVGVGTDHQPLTEPKGMNFFITPDEAPNSGAAAEISPQKVTTSYGGMAAEISPETVTTSYGGMAGIKAINTSTPTAGIAIATSGATTYCSTDSTGTIVTGTVVDETYTSIGTAAGARATTVGGTSVGNTRVELVEGWSCSTGSTVTTVNGRVFLDPAKPGIVRTWGGKQENNLIVGGTTIVTGGTVGTHLGQTKMTGGEVSIYVGGNGPGPGFWAMAASPSRDIPWIDPGAEFIEEFEARDSGSVGVDGKPCCKPTHIYTSASQLRDLWWNGPLNNWSSTTIARPEMPVQHVVVMPFEPGMIDSEDFIVVDEITQNTIVQVGDICYKIAMPRGESPTPLEWVRNNPHFRPNDGEALARGFWERCTCCPAEPGKVKLDGNEVTLDPPDAGADAGDGVDSTPSAGDETPDDYPDLYDTEPGDDDIPGGGTIPGSDPMPGGESGYTPDSDDGFDGGIWPEPWWEPGAQVADIPENGERCCFIAGTQISMADGSYKTIEDINPGDEVKTHNGTNTVTEISRPLLGNRKLHDVNNTGEYFATEDHLFMTTDGWKCLNVELQQENYPSMSHLATGQLDTTDTIITETGSVEVNSLDVCPIKDPNTQLYDLVVNEDSTYFANGLLVHNHFADACHRHWYEDDKDDPVIIVLPVEGCMDDGNWPEGTFPDRPDWFEGPALNYNENATLPDPNNPCRYPPTPDEIYGCMDPKSGNYNKHATIDDGSCDPPCILVEDEIGGWEVTFEGGPAPAADESDEGDEEDPPDNPIDDPIIPVYPPPEEITLPEEISCDEECDKDDLTY